jgi:hypothetical protein
VEESRIEEVYPGKHDAVGCMDMLNVAVQAALVSGDIPDFSLSYVTINYTGRMLVRGANAHLHSGDRKEFPNLGVILTGDR